ncbi:MAG: metalloregulator ArsR/SmtB family transcription factor [Candidatus Thorarchaeota archaeon]|nr:metalloregulator ArsR/SmtB family transcription factor [Candidatus Thorarchaeota archaeon]
MTNEKQIEWRVNFHKALSNVERLKIVDFLAQNEQCQCDIFPQIGLSQSTVSAYLTQLTRAGILKVRRDGVRKLYSIASPQIRKVIQSLREVAKTEFT